MTEIKIEYTEDYREELTEQFPVEFTTADFFPQSEIRTNNFQCEECLDIFQEVERYELHKYIHNPSKFCILCHRYFKVAKSFLGHIDYHQNKFFKCPFCLKGFFFKKQFNTHISEHKKKSKLFNCEYCEKTFKSKKEKNIHERVHTNVRPYECNICDKSFKQTGSLKTHMNTHKEEKMYSCYTCQGTFSTSSSLKRHINRMHARGRTISCKLCEEKFLNSDSFYQHRMDKHPELYNFYRICVICNEEFIARHQYKLHRKMHREKGEIKDMEEINTDSYNRQVVGTDAKFIQCSFCGSEIESEKQFTHENEHMQLTQKEVLEYQRLGKFSCKICEKVVTKRKSLLRHMNMHLEKLYFCEENKCSYKAIMTYMGMQHHKYKHHNKVTCHNCNKEFGGHIQVKKHFKTTSCGDKNHKYRILRCKKCKSAFTNTKHFRIHCNTHKKMNVYKCLTCNKKFPRFIFFRKHMAVAHKENIDSNNPFQFRFKIDPSPSQKLIPVKTKYSCVSCKKSFKTKTNFEEHKTSHLNPKYQCKKCKKYFVRCKNYLYHIKNNICTNWLAEAMITDPKELTCKFCGKEMSHIRSLARHIANMHVQANYQCQYCDSVLNSLERLKGHLIEKHSQEKKYFCALCNNGFITFRGLILHKRYHKRKRQIDRITSKCILENVDYKEKPFIGSIIKEELDSEIDIVDYPEKVIIKQELGSEDVLKMEME